eukprot:TRINITY_DN24112_c0_g2_i3.p1 TRINITY_DN24112_c0_g2~~TRINITY_DN24112_c0_g2_i3.p1  ORF type:complete len:734 (+),score=79.23 TRINITY_DN24112_c0_g2_i3:100-2301(+)
MRSVPAERKECVASVEHAPSVPVVPALLSSSSKVKTVTLEDVPTSDALALFLQDHGVATSDWGKGNTKAVSKFFDEMKGQEAELELWKKEDGTIQAVRVTHVLRAKVCSEESQKQGTFLFNTWQQFADGRKRTRNGLLSEKLCVSEIPIEEHLHEVCERAVTEEEMQRLENSMFILQPGESPPEYDPDYKCPLTVIEEHLCDHTIEVETSASYPGLLTMYHLYTVDIVCSGLPGVNFNTLEFNHDEKKSLKYIHAWVWLDWITIKRYLFEGSIMKERKKKGSYVDSSSMVPWLRQFDLALGEWGKGKNRSVDDLYAELENNESELELWGRTDGANLLMRVVHVLQLQVKNSELADCFLLHMWQQGQDGLVINVNRLAAQKLKKHANAEKLDEEHVQMAVKRAVQEQLSFIQDAFYTLGPNTELPNNPQSANIQIENLQFVDHRVDVDESPTYKGLHTMYHLYTVEVEISGLPLSDFTTIDIKRRNGPRVNGWRWVSWPTLLDTLHAQIQSLERVEARHIHDTEQIRQELDRGANKISQAVGSIAAVLEDCGDIAGSTEINRACKGLQSQVSNMEFLGECLSDFATAKQKQQGTARFPPSMMAKMASNTILSQEFLDKKKVERLAQKGISSRQLSKEMCPVPEEESKVDRRAKAPTRSVSSSRSRLATIVVAVLAIGRLVVDIAVLEPRNVGDATFWSSLILSLLMIGCALASVCLMNTMRRDASKDDIQILHI